jgi:hypothetical protein
MYQDDSTSISKWPKRVSDLLEIRTTNLHFTFTSIIAVAALDPKDRIGFPQ